MPTKIEQIVSVDTYLKIKVLIELVEAAKKVHYAMADQLYTIVEPFMNLHDIELNEELLEFLPEGGIHFELRRRNRALRKLAEADSDSEILKF